MSKLQALREKRKSQAAAMRQQADKMNAEGYAPSAEDNAAWSAMNTDYNATVAAVDREETADRVDTEIRSARDSDRIPPLDGGRDNRARGGDGASLAVTDEQRSMALGAWCRSQMGLAITDEQEASCRATRINPNAPQLAFNLLASHQIGSLQAIMRRGNAIDASERAMAQFGAAMSTQLATNGGFLIPPLTLSRSLEVNMLAYGGIFQACEIMTTSSGERMAWPTADDTMNMGIRLGENLDAGTEVRPVFGQTYWDAYKYSSTPIRVPHELLEDSVVDLPAVLGEMLGERLGRKTALDCTLGTGNAQPKGILTAAALGVTSAKVGAITADDFLKLEHSIDPAYRGGNGTGFMLNDASLLAIRLLKNGVGDYIFKSGADFSVPDRLCGYPIFINQAMPTVATGNKPILFGQLKKYKVRRVNGIRMYRLEERFRDSDQDGFLAFLRLDGNLLQSGTPPVKYLQIS